MPLVQGSEFIEDRYERYPFGQSQMCVVCSLVPLGVFDMRIPILSTRNDGLPPKASKTDNAQLTKQVNCHRANGESDGSRRIER